MSFMLLVQVAAVPVCGGSVRKAGEGIVVSVSIMIKIIVRKSV
jgi:hypothetical protein